MVESTELLPELPTVVGDSKPALHFAYAGEADPLPEMEPWPPVEPGYGFSVRRYGSHSRRIVLHFPDSADFYLDESLSSILVAPIGPVSQAMVRHLFLDAVVPLTLSSKGELVLHAASVLLGETAVLLVGHRGAGKSTLVAALARHGVRVLGDDAVLLHETPRGWEVGPSYPGIRLWPDSTEWLKVDPLELTRLADESDKLRWAPHAHGPSLSHPLLSHLVFLEGAPTRGKAQIALRSPRSALLAILEHTFYLSPMSREDEPRFELMARVADRYPTYTFRHQQDYTCLGEVIDTFLGAFGAQ